MPLGILHLHPLPLVPLIDAPLQPPPRILLPPLYLLLDLPNHDSLPLYLPLSFLLPGSILALPLVEPPQMFDPPPPRGLPETLNEPLLLVPPPPPLLVGLLPVATHLREAAGLLARRVNTLEEALVREAQVVDPVGDKRKRVLDGQARLRGAEQRGGVVLHQGDVGRRWRMKEQRGRGTMGS